MFTRTFMFLNLIHVCFLDPDVRIINGTKTETGEFPFMVSLHNNSKHFCGGTVLNKKHVLTAGHCVCDVRLINLTAHLTHTLEDPREKIPVKSVICHSDYSLMEHINDIAILELLFEIPRKLYHSVELVPTDFTVRDDLNGTLIGWGLTEDGNVSNALLKIDVIAYNDLTCSLSHFGMYDMEKNMCAGWPRNGKGSCQGDSGGPLLIGGFQAGIISFGLSSNCGISSREHPKVLTRISKYVDWIKEEGKYEEGTGGGSDTQLHRVSFCVLILLYAQMF